MILLVSAVFGVGLGLLTGGRLRRCAHYPLRAALLPIAALVCKFCASWFFAPQRFAVAVCVLQYALVFAFLWLNRKRPAWPPVLFIGAFSNFLVILLNGGCMPVSAALMGANTARAEALAAGKIYAYAAINPQTRLPFLGDVLRFGPSGQPFGFASAGDLVLCAGIVLLCVLMMHCRAPEANDAAQGGDKGRA